MKRQIIIRGFAVWIDLPSTVIWFEVGKDKAHALIEGTWWQRMAMEAAINAVAPYFGTAMTFVIEYYRGKLKKHVGPNGIWVALKVVHPTAPARPLLAYAKKRTEANKMKTPDPWEPTTSNIL